MNIKLTTPESIDRLLDSLSEQGARWLETGEDARSISGRLKAEAAHDDVFVQCFYYPSGVRLCRIIASVLPTHFSGETDSCTIRCSTPEDVDAVLSDLDKRGFVWGVSDAAPKSRANRLKAAVKTSTVFIETFTVYWQNVVDRTISYWTAAEAITDSEYVNSIKQHGSR